MFYDEKTLYQKQYHTAERLETEIEELQQLGSEGTSKVEHREANAFFRKLEKACVCKLRSDRTAGKDVFIELAKKFSEDYEIDIKITQKAYFVEASLRMDHMIYFKSAAQMLAELIGMSDRICTFAIPGDTEHFQLYLDYFTHDCWIGGKKIWT